MQRAGSKKAAAAAAAANGSGSSDASRSTSTMPFASSPTASGDASAASAAASNAKERNRESLIAVAAFALVGIFALSTHKIGATLWLALAARIAWRCLVADDALPARRAPRPALKGWAKHAEDVEGVRRDYALFLKTRNAGDKVALRRSAGGVADSNRTLAPLYKKKAAAVDVSRLAGVIAVDLEKRLLHVEPGAPQDELAAAALARGLVPAVVPEFPGITAGGAFSGGGIESTSAAEGSVADTVESLDVITGDGRFLTGVSRTNHPDLFAAAAAGFGTVGVITRLALRCVRAPKFVTVSYLHLDGTRSATAALERLALGTASSSPPASSKSKAASKKSLAPPEFLDGVALGPRSAVVVVGTPADAAPACGGAPLLRLRSSRRAPWFFWRLADVGRSSPALTGAGFIAAWDALVAAKGAEQPDASLVEEAESATADDCRPSAHPSGLPVAHPGEYPGCVGCETLPLEDYLFRFDRGAFWMARHGLQMFYGRAAWRDEKGDPEIISKAPASSASFPKPLAPPADPTERAGPAPLIRCKYAWLATTRQLYRMLHHVGDNTLARTYVVQDFVMPSSAAAAEFVEKHSAPPNRCGIWPLWLCPVRHVPLPGAGGAGYGFPYQAREETPPGGIWVNVGVYGRPLQGKPFDPLEVNSQLETGASNLGGRKMLYAQSFYTRGEFDSLFDHATYDLARRQYASTDPVNRPDDFAFPDAASKLLLGDERRAKMQGVDAASGLLNAWKPMVPWYFSLWSELLLPRALHGPLGLRHTAPPDSSALPPSEVRMEGARARAERVLLPEGAGGSRGEEGVGGGVHAAIAAAASSKKGQSSTTTASAAPAAPLARKRSSLLTRLRSATPTKAET